MFSDTGLQAVLHGIMLVLLVWLLTQRYFGLIGVASLLHLSIYLFFRAVRGIRSLSSGDPQRYIGIGGLVGIVALTFHSLVERNIQVPANAFLYVVLWAVVIRTDLWREYTNRPRKESYEFA